MVLVSMMVDDMRNLDMMVEHHVSRLRVVEVRAHWTAPGGWSPTCHVYRFEVYVSYSRRVRNQAPEWGVDGILARDGFPDEIALYKERRQRGGPFVMLLNLINAKVRHDLEMDVSVRATHLMEAARDVRAARPQTYGWKPRRELTEDEIAENIEASRHVWMRRTAG